MFWISGMFASHGGGFDVVIEDSTFYPSRARSCNQFPPPPKKKRKGRRKDVIPAIPTARYLMVHDMPCDMIPRIVLLAS